MAARRGAAHSPSAEVPLAVRWALNGEGDAGGIIGMYELRQVLHAAGLSSEGNKEELVERIRNNKEVWQKPPTSVTTERSRRILSPSERNRDRAATEAKSPMPRDGAQKVVPLMSHLATHSWPVVATQCLNLSCSRRLAAISSSIQ